MNPKEKFNTIALNMVTCLECFEECNEVYVSAGQPATHQEFFAWERKHLPQKLPLDLRAFYGIFNGIQVHWDAQVGDKLVTLGEIRLFPLEEIQRMPIDGSFEVVSPHRNYVNGRLDTGYSANGPNGGTGGGIGGAVGGEVGGGSSGRAGGRPPDGRSAAFVIDVCDVGTVCLLYWCADHLSMDGEEGGGGSRGNSNNSNNNSAGEGDGNDSGPEVWLVDLCHRWHYMCPSFTHYMRLCVTHLGIYGWQLAYTPEGLSATTQQWMTMFCKDRLAVDTLLLPSSSSSA